MQRARSDQDKDKRKAALLDAALEEFFERGFVAARMDDIARRAGLSKGAIYLYFNAKEDLFTSLIELHAAPKVDMMISLTENAASFALALKMLTQAAPLLIRESKVPRLLKILVGDSTHFPHTVRLYRERVIDRMLEALTRLLKHSHESGEIHVEQPELTARLVVAPVVLAAVWHVVFAAADPDAVFDLDAYFEQHFRLIKRALSSPGADEGAA